MTFDIEVFVAFYKYFYIKKLIFCKSVFVNRYKTPVSRMSETSEDEEVSDHVMWLMTWKLYHSIRYTCDDPAHLWQCYEDVCYWADAANMHKPWPPNVPRPDDASK